MRMISITRVLAVLTGLMMLIGMTGVAAAEQDSRFAIAFDITQEFDVYNETARIAENTNTHIPGHGEGDYTLVLRDGQGDILYETATHFSLSIMTHSGHDHDMEVPELRYYARIPYDDDAVTAELSEEDTVLASLDLPDMICDDPKNDAERVYCGVPIDDGLVDDPDDGLPWLLILTGVLLLSGLVAGGTYLYRRRQEQLAEERELEKKLEEL